MWVLCADMQRLRCVQERRKFIEMWLKLEDDLGDERMVSSVMEPGAAVFFNPTHPHRGPQKPFPLPPEETAHGRKRRRPPSKEQRRTVFMAAVHTAGSSEKYAIFARAANRGKGQDTVSAGVVWHDPIAARGRDGAFGVSQDERDEVSAQMKAGGASS